MGGSVRGSARRGSEAAPGWIGWDAVGSLRQEDNLALTLQRIENTLLTVYPEDRTIQFFLKPVASKTRTSTGRGGAELASLGSTLRTRRLHSWHLCHPKPKQFTEYYLQARTKEFLCKLAEEQTRG